MIASKGNIKKVLGSIKNIFEDADEDGNLDKEIERGNTASFQDEAARHEKEAFLEGYRYAIRILEEGIVKEAQ